MSVILELVNSFLDRPGNIGIRTARVLRALQERSSDDVLCLARGGRVKGDGIRSVGMGPLGHLPRLLNAARIFLFPGFNHRALDIRLFEWFCASVLSVQKPLRVDVAHVWDYAPSLIQKLKSKGVPVILDVPIAPSAYAERLWREGRCSHLLRDPRQIALEQRAFRLADILLVPSQFVAEELEKIGISKEAIRVVQFGVDTLGELPSQSHDSLKQENGLCSGIHWVLLGNVNFRKGVQELLEAWSDPMFAGDTLHLCGRLNPVVRELLKQAGTNVHTPGFIKPTEYLKQCHVFVMPSWMEGSSKAVFEAMAMGLPAIVSRSTGSVVRHGVDGFIVEAGDVEELKAAMLRFKQDPSLLVTMGQNAFERAGAFTWKRYADAVIAVYDEFT